MPLANSTSPDSTVLAGCAALAGAAAMAFKLIESAQAGWRAVNAPHIVRAGARFEKGKLIERDEDQAPGTQGQRLAS